MKKLIWVLVALVSISLCGVVGLVMRGEGKPVMIYPEDEGTTTMSSPSPTKRPNTIREGSWEVGTDVKPGKYKTSGAMKSAIPLCYWDVKKADEITDQGVKDKPGAQGIVTLVKGDVFTTNGCEPWYVSK